MIHISIAAVLTAGVYLCHRYNREWNYGFGILFFAGIPFAGLLEDGFISAVWGYNLGAAILIFFTLFAFCLEYYMTGNWETSV